MNQYQCTETYIGEADSNLAIIFYSRLTIVVSDGDRQCARVAPQAHQAR